jgi:hypothetical protein
MDLSLLPVPVAVVRDGWDWLGIWCNVGAFVVALATIVLSALTNLRNNRANVRDRRSFFELDVLARVIEVCGYNLPGSLQVLQGLLVMLPEEDLPGIRNEAEHGRVPSNDTLSPFMGEYREAAARRLRDGADGLGVL